MPTQQRMTKAEFEQWADRVVITARAPYDLVPCPCRDINCHGWRFVERQGEQTAAIRELAYETVAG